MSRSWEELEAEMDAYIGSRQYKFDQFIYRMRRILTSPLRWPKNIKYWFQRANRGYADCDVWNGDTYLAGQIAGILIWLVEKGHGVSMAYSDDDSTPVEIMVERRDKEYLYYASIFAEYRKNGSAYNQEWADDFGGVLDKDMQDALQWLSQHFQELWD